MKNLKKIFSLVSILFTLILVLSAANMVHAIEVTATIPVGTNPEGVAYDSGKGEIFVANSDSNSISVLSDSSNTSTSQSSTLPELSGAVLILVIVAVVVVILCAVALAVKKSARTHPDSKQKTK